MILGKVTNREVTVSRESDGPVLLLQVELTNERDVQDVELIKHAGVDFNPPDGSFVVVIPLANAFKVAVAVDDGIESEVDPGEYEIYSSKSGLKKAKTRWNTDGEVIHNDGDRLVARKEDEITITPETDPDFFVLMNGLAALLSKDPITSVTGKINEGTDEVKVP